MTKKQNAMYENYKCAHATHIDQLYGNFSSAKLRAYEYCSTDCVNHRGYDFRVFGANSCFFSAAFRYMKDGVEHLRYHTYANVYDFEIA